MLKKNFGKKIFKKKFWKKLFPNFGTVCRRLVNMLTQRMLMTDLNSFQSINLSQFFVSVKFRSGSGSGYHLVIDFCIVMFHMLMILMKFSFVPKTFFRIHFFFRIRITQCNSLEKVILHMLNIFKKFGHALQSFCENKNSIQDQGQDQDHGITLDFNTRPTFHT